jgi:hypothetical protein
MEECEMDALIFFDILMAKSSAERIEGCNYPGL